VSRFSKQTFLIFFLLLPSVATSQSSSANTAGEPSVPTDPKQFLALAAKVNGLASEAIGPWHVKATFQVTDNAGKAQESGTYEAFLKSPHQYKISYQSPAYTRTLWANDSGNFATSDPKWPGNDEWMVRRSLFDVTPEPRSTNFREMLWREAAPEVKAQCLDMKEKFAPPGLQSQATYCFNTGTPVLRYGSEDLEYYQAVFNNIIPFHGAYVARDVALLHAGKPYFRLHVDLLELLSGPTDDLFRPDPGAIPVKRRVLLDTDLRFIETLKQEGIPRPVNQKWRTAQPLGQEVIVQVLVNKNGDVVAANPIMGDSLMKFQGTIAAGKWRFKPYLVEGEPTEFYTELEFF
jgi:hypothetical protein